MPAPNSPRIRPLAPGAEPARRRAVWGPGRWWPDRQTRSLLWAITATTVLLHALLFAVPAILR